MVPARREPAGAAAPRRQGVAPGSVSFGALRRSMVPWLSAIWTSAAFGLSHDLSPLAEITAVSAGTRTVTGEVTASAVVGLAFGRLRPSSGRVITPIPTYGTIDGAVSLAAASR